MSTVFPMGRKQTSSREEKPAKPDRHKPRRMAAVRKHFHGPAEKLAARLGCDMTELVNLAVRELLEKHGLWPPQKEVST